MDQRRFEPAMFTMEAWYTEPPAVDAEAVRAYLEREVGFPVALASGKGPLMFAFSEFVTDFEEGDRAPALATLLSAHQAFDGEARHAALQQSWDFPDAAEILAHGRHSLLGGEMLARGLPYEQRMALFRALTMALVELTHPIALYSGQADFFVHPQRWFEAQRDGYEYYGFFNVRSFNISNDPGVQVMDTLGLGIFGVPDLQVHFRDLDNDQLATLLYNTGIYLMERGDVIEDGHTVPGIDPATAWRCHHEKSLVGPEREVVDLCPQEPYAAGKRAS